MDKKTNWVIYGIGGIIGYLIYKAWENKKTEQAMMQGIRDTLENYKRTNLHIYREEEA